MMYLQLAQSYQDSLKVLEADIQHANALASAIPRGKGGARFQMKLVYNQWAPLFLFLLQRIDCSCICLLPRYLNLFHILFYKIRSDGRPNLSTQGRKATIKEFYGMQDKCTFENQLLLSSSCFVVHLSRLWLISLKNQIIGVILPSLQRLHSNLEELEDVKELNSGKKWIGGDLKLANVDTEREDECGICLEPCTKMVTPNCCHAMCIKCYRNWNTRSESCPFCRGSLKRVNSEDLWVLTCNTDVVDTKTASKEDLLRFYLYINSLPKDYPDALFLVYYEYLI